MTEPSPFGLLTRFGRPVQWTALIAATLVLSTLFELFGLPAALLLGALVAGILVSTAGATLRVPAPLYLGMQPFVSCLIARVITFEIILEAIKDWPLFLSSIVAVIGASTFLGWILTRYQVLPGTTAVWGTSPGAAQAMLMMSEAFGADMRLVALMQYLRVVFVAITATVIGRLWIGSAAAPAAVVWFPAVDWIDFAETVAFAVAAAFLGRRSGIPAAGFLLPLALGATLNIFGLIHFVLPPWLLAICYTVVGWRVGLVFTRGILLHALRVLPQLLLSTIALIAFCGGVGWVLTLTTGIDPLSTYLATSPGGMDSVAIIAASTKVDVPFVMALQISRFVILTFIGPWLARAMARSLGKVDG